jgi:transposase
MRLLARSSQACQRLMIIPGVGQLTALAFVAPSMHQSVSADRVMGSYLDLVPRRFQSGEIDYVAAPRSLVTGGYEPCCMRQSNVLLPRYPAP